MWWFGHKCMGGGLQTAPLLHGLQQQRHDWGCGCRIGILCGHGGPIPDHSENIFEKVGDHGHSEKSNNLRKKEKKFSYQRRDKCLSPLTTYHRPYLLVLSILVTFLQIIESN